MRKVMVCFLALIMLMTVSCKSAATPPASTKAPTAVPTAAPTVATTKVPDPITLKAFVNYSPFPKDWKWGMDEASKQIKALTGVSIEFTNATTSDGTELNLLLASGSKLPDFIYCGVNSTARNTLVSEGYVQPLNKLADKYDKSFWDVLPTDMQKLYTEADGNMYCVADYFGDSKKLNLIKFQAFGNDSAISIKNDLYEKAGKPKIDTLDQFVDLLLKVKKDNPTLNHVLLDRAPNSLTALQNYLVVFYRLHGGKFYVDTNGNAAKLMFTTPKYKEALKVANKLAQGGIINRDIYTYKSDQFKAAYMAQDLFAYTGDIGPVYSAIGVMDKMLFTPIEPPMAAGVSRADYQTNMEYFNFGSNGVFITKDTINAERAIKYLSFLLSYEGQLIQCYGPRDIAWIEDEFKLPKYTDAKKNLEKESSEKLAREMGVYNNWFEWLLQGYSMRLGAHNTSKDYVYMAPEFNVYFKYAKDERPGMYAALIKDEDTRLLNKQINDNWTVMIPEIVFAKTQAEFDSAYEKMLKQADTLGLKKLEDYYSKRLTEWNTMKINPWQNPQQK